jgi:aminoglycoside 6'-N-acetyltransferase
VPDAAISFRRLSRADLGLLTIWLNTPHVYAWWGETSGSGFLGGPDDTAATLEMVEAVYGAAIDGYGSTEHHVIQTDGEPIGMIQWYRLADEPGYAAEIGESADGTAGVDVLIGNPDAVGRGVGPLVIAAFVRSVVLAAPGVRRVVAGPDARNARSVRAFEKAGFRPVRDAPVDRGHHTERVMVRDHSEQSGSRER